MKKGRPRQTDDQNVYRHVGFKADDETLAAIDELIAAMPIQSGARPSKSVVIRHCLIEAAKRLGVERAAAKKPNRRQIGAKTHSKSQD